MFEKVIGQNQAKRYISQAIQKDRLHHAYIFQGPSGIGKKTFALELAKILLETDSSLENDPDFNIISPEGNFIKIDQIRALVKEIQIRPYKKKKIYIVDKANQMTSEAQNSLLKTLEEPPSYAHIILLSHDGIKLMNTIESRCEKINFFPLSKEEIQLYLTREKNIDCNEASLLSFFCMGIVSRALNLIESKDFLNHRTRVEKFINYLLKKNIVNILSSVKYLEENKEQIEDILDLSITYFRDILVYLMTNDENLLINKDRIEMIESFSKELSKDVLIESIEEMEKAKKKLKSNCNFALTLEAMVININEVVSKWLEL